MFLLPSTGVANICIYAQLFTWVLQSQTQVLMIVQQPYFPLEPSPQPAIFVLQKVLAGGL